MAYVFGTDRDELIDELDGVTLGADVIFGYGGDDTIIAHNEADHLKGGGGADRLDGGAGRDTAHYGDSPEGVTVSLNSGQGYGGTAQGDTLRSIENLTGSFYGDFLHGHGHRNLLTGLAGDDMLFGYGSLDILEGGDGDDILVGGLHPDMLHGGAGSDTASYSGSPAGVTVMLMSGAERFGGDATGDEFSSIENLIGSSHDDVLGGDDGINVLRGYDGNDTLEGYGGDDRLEGGDGADRLHGGGGADNLRGGVDNDTFVFSGDFGRDIILILRLAATTSNSTGRSSIVSPRC